MTMGLLLNGVLLLLWRGSTVAFVTKHNYPVLLRQNSHHRRVLPWSAATTVINKKPATTCTARSTSTTTTTELNMVFDFFQKRTQEGLEQIQKLSDAASKGKLSEGLAEMAVYTQQTNAAFAAGLAKSRNRLLQNLDTLFSMGSSSSGEDVLLEELQDVLLQADLGMSTAEDIVAEVKSLQQQQDAASTTKRLLSRDDLMSIMRGKLIEALENNVDNVMDGSIRFSEDDDSDLPTVLFVMGANGMGKTTTIGKLAHRLRTEGNQTVLVAACDTFRAGAVEQLQQWADRAQVDCFVPTERRNSPSAVLYGALDKAILENYDTVLVDTSGRLSNNEALTAELVKMKKVIQKRLSVENDKEDNNKPILNTNVPHETLLVLDAAQGRMALDSAKVWNEEVGLTGLILTKLDGSARGGSVVAVSRELGLPVKLIGVGEGIEDLRDFEPSRFVDSLLGIGEAGGSSSSSAKDEGALLESRLVEMRKERDARSKQQATAKKTPAAAVPMMGGGGGAGEMTFQEMDAMPAEPSAGGGGGGGRRGKPNRSNKKKKKKRRR